MIRSKEFDTLARRLQQEHGQTLIEHVRDQLAAGRTVTEIARALGIDRQRLYSYVQAAGYRFQTFTRLEQIVPELAG